MMPCFLVVYYPFSSYMFSPFFVVILILLQLFYYYKFFLSCKIVYLNQQVVGHLLLSNVPSADLAHSCDVVEAAPVSSFLACLFELAAKQTVLFNHCELRE